MGCGYDGKAYRHEEGEGDIGMLQLCGLGVAVGNAISEVKNKADLVIGSNDEDGIAVFIEEKLFGNGAGPQ